MPRRSKKEKYAENPFIGNAIIHTVTGTKMIYANPTGQDTFACVDKTSGEARDISFGKRIEVDKTRFLKFYAEGVRMFLGLSAPGIKVFMVIYQQLIGVEEYQQQKIELIYDLLEDDVKKEISASTFYRGVNELKKVKLIAPTLIDGIYWLNIDYVFKGDRLTLVNQYVLKDKQR